MKKQYIVGRNKNQQLDPVSHVLYEYYFVVFWSVKKLKIYLDLRYMVVEELIELMVPVIYIFIDITLWFMPNKDLVAGLGNSAFGYTRPTSLEYIPPLILVIVVEFFSFFFLVKVIKAKCQINLWTAMKLFVHTDGRYCIYFALFAFITTNVFRYVPLGCNIHLDFRWRYE